MPNSNNELADFLRNILGIHSRRTVDELIPKIQRYAVKLYGAEVVQLEDDHAVHRDHGQSGGSLGSWLGALCLERTSLSKQQEAVRAHLRDYVDWSRVSEWELGRVLMAECGLNGTDTVSVIQELFLRHRVQLEMEEAVDGRQSLCDLTVSILMDFRSKQMEQIVARCTESARMGIDESYFLNEIVVDDEALRQFLKQNIGHRPLSDIEPLMRRIRGYLEDLDILRLGRHGVT